MTSVSIVNFSGRLFDKAVKAKEDGLMAEITFAETTTTKKQSSIGIRALGVCFNDVGDQFIATDSRGCVTMFYLTQNRYM